MKNTKFSDEDYLLFEYAIAGVTEYRRVIQQFKEFWVDYQMRIRTELESTRFSLPLSFGTPITRDPVTIPIRTPIVASMDGWLSHGLSFLALAPVRKSLALRALLIWRDQLTMQPLSGEADPNPRSTRKLA